MDHIIVENVRCFQERQSVPLKPITLLVGENSTGKTTVLAMARLAWDLCKRGPVLDFNEEPFLWGTYDQIATFRGGRAGRAESFTIGLQMPTSPHFKKKLAHSSSDVITITGRFVGEAQPQLREWTFESDPFRVQIKFSEEENQVDLMIKLPDSEEVIEGAPAPPQLPFGFPEYLFYLRYYYSEMRRNRAENSSEAKVVVPPAVPELLEAVYYELHLLGPRPYAFAPIRTRPQRIYPPFKNIPVPEGTHVPVILADTASSDPESWKTIQEALNEFGEHSGLFRNIRVRRLGKKPSDPFQIRIKISGPDRNLIDVGYGVSQVLPIVVDVLRESKESTLLLQQPEVHLHPKAQAMLASFLAFAAKHYDMRLLIETHSDYIIDRIRMEVRDEDYLTSDDVVILYSEREKGVVRIRPLQIDNFGNIVNAPPSYRQFFLEEQKRLLWD